jgi:hypothetical protein
MSSSPNNRATLAFMLGQNQKEMAMGVIVVPIVGGKLDAWKQWATELTGTRAEELKDLNNRYGLTRHAAWLTETPAGPAVVALHEGPGAEQFMEKLTQSNNDFDVWFRGKVEEFHGTELTQPSPGPASELHLDSGS